MFYTGKRRKEILENFVFISAAVWSSYAQVPGTHVVMQFNLIYVAAFVMNLGRCVVEIVTITYYFVYQEVPPVIQSNKAGYYIMYMTLEFVPMLLYLMSIKVSGGSNRRGKDEGEGEGEPRYNTDNRNSIITEMVDRMSLDL